MMPFVNSAKNGKLCNFFVLGGTLDSHPCKNATFDFSEKEYINAYSDIQSFFGTKGTAIIGVDKHGPKILPLNVEKLGEKQAPVEGKLNHVVPPHVVEHWMVGEIHPAIDNVPEPGLITEHVKPIPKHDTVNDPSPTSFRELVQF